MTIPRLLALHGYWRDAPPVHIALNRLNSALLKPAAGGSGGSKQQQTGNLGDLVREFGAAGGEIQG